MVRTRSEYRCSRIAGMERATVPGARQLTDDDRNGLAGLLLDAYRGSVDDEGEDEADAVEAMNEYLSIIDREQSRVVANDDRLVAMCLVLHIDDVPYINTIAVAPDHKQAGLGRSLVAMVLGILADDGASSVGAVITDGNTPSEKLFAGLEFIRVGAWGQGQG